MIAKQEKNVGIIEMNGPTQDITPHLFKFGMLYQWDETDSWKETRFMELRTWVHSQPHLYLSIDRDGSQAWSICSYSSPSYLILYMFFLPLPFIIFTKYNVAVTIWLHMHVNYLATHFPSSGSFLLVLNLNLYSTDEIKFGPQKIDFNEYSWFSHRIFDFKLNFFFTNFFTVRPWCEFIVVYYLFMLVVVNRQL